jgi:hypothetical protein
MPAYTSLPATTSGAVVDGRFIDDKDAILRALSARHRFPLPHP